MLFGLGVTSASPAAITADRYVAYRPELIDQLGFKLEGVALPLEAGYLVPFGLVSSTLNR